jgi:hypothetical protein
MNSLKQWKPGDIIETEYITWHYWLDQFYTFIAQNIIVGVESYLPAAVQFELGARGQLNEEIMSYIRDPFRIKKKGGTAKKYYVLLPEYLSPDITLDKYNPKLWNEVCLFYRTLRNPIFHGMQFDTQDSKYIIFVLELVADIYGWIDSWHNPDSMVPGNSWFTELDRT